MSKSAVPAGAPFSICVARAAILTSGKASREASTASSQARTSGDVDEAAVATGAGVV
jgi:hypothetical protein